MSSEINKDFYCSANCHGTALATEWCRLKNRYCKTDCENRHRKHPTPQQFREEYGREYPDDGAAYALMTHGMAGIEDWIAVKYGDYCEDGEPLVCACTPFCKPDKDWRPE